MLDKEGWRLLFNLDNLITGLFKAKYFAGSDFLSVNFAKHLLHRVLA